MIPRHIPPCGLPHLMRTAAQGDYPSVEVVEATLADRYGSSHAVLLPSVRAGLRWMIESQGGRGRVFTPVFTCAVVHEAVKLAGTEVKFVDCEEDGILMGRSGLMEATPADSVIYSMIYGKAFDFPYPDAKVNLLDFAMTIPRREDIASLKANEVAFYSFGIGKILYSGIGSIAFCESRSLWKALLEKREAIAVHEQVSTYRYFSKMLQRRVIHGRAIYGALRSLQAAISKRASAGPAVSDDGAAHADASCWTHMPCGPNRRILLDNCLDEDIGEQILARIKVYKGILENVPGLVVLGGDSVMSHFPVIVDGARRDAIVSRLRTEGIDSATYFGFPGNLVAEAFPNAHRASKGVLGLPISSLRNDREAERVARAFLRALQQ